MMIIFSSRHKRCAPSASLLVGPRKSDRFGTPDLPASSQPFDMFQSIELDGFAELDRGQMQVGAKAARSSTVVVIPQSPSPRGKRVSFHPPPASKIAHLGPRKAAEMASPSVTRDVR